MGMLKVQLLIVLIIYVNESSCVIDALYDAGEKVWDFYSTLGTEIFNSSAHATTVEELLGNNHGVNEEIRERMHEIHVKVQEIEISMNHEIMRKLLNMVESRVLLVRTIDMMRIYLKNINREYAIFYDILIRDGYIHNRSLGNLLSVFPEIEPQIEIIRNFMTDAEDLIPDEGSLITAIIGYAKTRYEEICSSSQPIDEILVHLFKVVIVAEIKCSLMGFFANIQRYSANQAWKEINRHAKIRFKEYFGKYLSILRRNFHLTTGLYIRACDPKNGTWIRDKNYYALDGIRQAMFFLYDLSCEMKACGNIWKTRSTRCDARFFDARSGCLSSLTRCQKTGTVQACILKDGPRKFQYLNSSLLGFLGNNSECPACGGYIFDNREGPYAKYSTCSCLCEGNHNKISLVAMEIARTSHKVVMTGLRFIRQNNILHIQPKVGELMANGYIEKNSERWLPIPNDIDESQLHSVDSENSVFFLDDVVLPPGFVLRGVKFNKVTKENVKGFAIEIFGVPFDYRSGQLDLQGRISSTSSRRKLGWPLIYQPISPLQSELHNIPNSPECTHIYLELSTLRNDYGQSMLPLFDAVPVETQPPSALSGIGIFHKGAEDYAGFISLRAYGVRYMQYFENFTSTHTIKGRLQLFN